MQKSITSKEYQVIIDELVRLRKEAGLTQRELADRLGREQSFIWRIEHRERRIDLLEFYWICKAIKTDPPIIYSRMCHGFDTFSTAPGVKYAVG